MKYCNNCGAKLIPGSKYCNECGAQIIENVQSNDVVENYVYYVNRNDDPYGVYANTGFGLGLAGLIASFFSIVGFFLCIPGLILSIYGLKSTRSHGRAQAGLIMSIIAIALQILSTLACIYCFCIAFETGYYEAQYDFSVIHLLLTF